MAARNIISELARWRARELGSERKRPIMDVIAPYAELGTAHYQVSI
jgi:hypothetical protein